MEMNDEIRDLENLICKESAEKCIECNHKCFMYVVFNYINENGYDFFVYQYGNKSLPQEVSIATDKFLKIFGSFLTPDTWTVVTIPWCDDSPSQ